MDTMNGPTVLGVWAHPDDEAYLSAGLMMRAVAAGSRVTCCYATRGERGTPDPDRWTPAQVGARRDREVRRALGLVGAGGPRYLGFADGECAVADTDVAVERLVAVIVEERPSTIVTFGSDGITGHPDHRAVSSWVVAACDVLRRQGDDVPDVLVPAMSESWLRRHRSLHERVDLFAYGPAVATPDDEIVREVALTPSELDLKRRVLAAHRSQTAELARLVGESTYRRWWDVERFRRLRPAEVGLATTGVGR